MDRSSYGGHSRTRHGSSDGGEVDKPRRRSLRNAVRKLFSRRSKEIEPQLSHKSVSRHVYHRSEPFTLAPAIELPEPASHEENVRQSTRSAPLSSTPPPALHRTRSPYAVEFPQSARLKPLNLGSPLPTPGRELRRRKTLPNVLMPESEDAALAPSMGSSPPPVPSFDIARDPPHPEAGQAVTSNIKSKRRSRSAGDMQSILAAQTPTRKRSDEIKYWRESFHANVLRADGFMSLVPGHQTPDEDATQPTPTAQTNNPFQTSAPMSPKASSSPRVHHGPAMSAVDVNSVSGLGTETSRDLEDRVASLEHGLQQFQCSLLRLSNERNRKTVVVGGIPPLPTSGGLRSPSMLADTPADLHPPPSWCNYDEAQWRPSTSPQPAPTMTRSIHSVAPTGKPALPPMPATARSYEPRGFPSSPLITLVHAARRRSLDGGSHSAPTDPPQHTFQSLYDMLADERIARRRLETQLHNMRQEIHDLQYQQASVASRIHSQRSSFVPLDPALGSSRLRELLRETESSPLNTARSPQRDSGNTGFSSTAPGMVSRFSGSDSETGAAEESEESITTPYDAYQTPREERSRYPLGSDGSSDEGEMF